MKAILNILLLCFLGLTLESRLKTKCAGLNFDCSWETKCCKGYYCVNDRCVLEKGKDTLEYTPKGDRCNGAHLCPKDYKCESHRCIKMSDVVIAEMVESRRFLLEQRKTK